VPRTFLDHNEGAPGLSLLETGETITILPDWPPAGCRSGGYTSLNFGCAHLEEMGEVLTRDDPPSCVDPEKIPAVGIGILSTHTSRNTQFTTSFQALTKHALCSLIRTILYPQCMQPKKQSSYRRLPRKPPTLEFLLSAIGDAQSLVKKGRATNRDLKSWECKYLRFSRVKSIA